ncbi:hypothetical protein CABS01_09370 [Colletotrichum abscissum]|uniref:Uncharacterized protein n=1 Tax=Colletotrichum abscissum TaxID=1671311 RepID=A0A9P9XLL3_9PEZI|nr:uncharacterized protein CABS01_09370 [Colletotrichum abscissum]KAI3555856.1 hypothetical protein CABS02_03910 [Colletotrichum abscissum]KAK1502759.1 hypothetical protein CABS01_09370 [Colletotrichum abscissum]
MPAHLQAVQSAPSSRPPDQTSRAHLGAIASSAARSPYASLTPQVVFNGPPAYLYRSDLYGLDLAFSHALQQQQQQQQQQQVPFVVLKFQ